MKYLYHLTPTNGIVDRDLHVIAESYDEAIAIWVKHYDIDPSHHDDHVDVVCLVSISYAVTNGVCDPMATYMCISEAVRNIEAERALL